jgi:hypothetical protein
VSPRRGLAAVALLLGLGAITADAQQICCSGGGGGSVTYPLTAPNGSSSAPSYSFSNGTDSGMYAPSNGYITLQAGTEGATANGGNITITAGTGGTTSGNGGTVTINGGTNGMAAGNGGGVAINGGNGDGVNKIAGGISLTAGVGTGTQVGGSVTLAAGQGGTSSAGGGNIVLSPATIVGGTSAGSVLEAAGSGSGQFHAAGLINAALSSTGNGADTTEDTLQTYSLPTNSLDNVSRCVRITTWGILAANADNKTIKLYFGGSVISSGTLTSSGVNWRSTLTVCKTGASTQSVLGEMSVGATMIAPYYNAGTDTDSSAITIKTTGQAGTANANDIVSKGQIVEFLS